MGIFLPKSETMMTKDEAKEQQLLVPIGQYYAARCTLTAKVFILHCVEPHIKLVDLTPEHMTTLSVSSIVSGLYQDKTFFAGTPQMILAESDVVTLVIGTTTLQGHFATTADEAVEKLARAVKSGLCSRSSTSTINSQHE